MKLSSCPRFANYVPPSQIYRYFIFRDFTLYGIYFLVLLAFIFLFLLLKFFPPLFKFFFLPNKRLIIHVSPNDGGGGIFPYM
jgi:hypothetical protein